MKILINYVLLLFISFQSLAQTKIISWNLENFGKSKSQSTLNFIANTVRDYDIVAIQEVVAGYGGSQTVAKLAILLNEKGAKWDYIISDPTSGTSYKKERYAFLWKTNKAKLKGEPWLEKKYNLEIDREPYFATFEVNKKTFTLVNFHAITKSKQPETEIKYFKFLPQQYPNLNLVFTGDFNCPESHTVFNPLKKMGYTSMLQKQKTTLKQKCNGDVCLASEFDNTFYNPNRLNHIDSGVILFYKKFNTLQDARKISDHIPIWLEFSLN
ncbi:Metal-dependent hydrolase, endonuclease/exonuclease/phosphatase family [Flavobacterium sp. CF108]|uniref:endonuclease/exonuclease/phosphatase family protein n=1 Tax=unclassified Flavobacterium TaxID=196869 RepID=UPI0008C34DFB|nr:MULTISPECIES: endonuclease/exonuclease/phosphatase family protein [unclassified Flavobacterium]SEP36378.1 Metal-dependent hydrolase, endonuclease/exonuclease/phosphatase family [Flavobacterium sp. fv08]SHI09553.1 Metal-dependent hydrolase, endonuclease/exonuclease/phosphatase family [Flavobacterium sp. CF108]